MKKKGKWVALGLAAALIAGGLWWYTWPVTLSQLYPMVQVSQSAAATGGYLIVDGKRTEGGALISTRGTFTLTEEDEAFGELIRLLRNAAFRRKLTIHLPWDNGFRSHPYAVGDIRWQILFRFDNSIPDEKGNGSTGYLIQLDNYYGEITFSDMINNKSWSLRANETLLQEIYDLLAQNGTIQTEDSAEP